MKKIALFCISIALGSGALFSQYWYYLPGIISDIVAPIGDNRRVSWKQGPERPSHGVQDSPPNVVLIVADDLGFNDITFYGGGIADGTVPTPHIDSIAQKGIHFTHGYSGNGTCAPSRAALLTGRYPSRVGFEFTPASPTFSKLTAGDAFIEENTEHYPAAEDIGLPTDELTLPELLKQRGYYSIGLGKWHLGGGEGSRPLDQGFDEFLGFRSGAGLFMNEDDEQVVNSKQDFDPIDKFLWANLKYAVRFNGGERFAPDSHMTDYISRQAVEAIILSEYMLA